MSRTPALPSGLSLRQPATLIATWFGIGLLPWAPGSWGSLAALPLGWAIYQAFGSFAVAGAALLVFVAGWWACGGVLRRAASTDPSYIVVDEVAGQLLALAVVPADPLFYAAAFLGFRALDIVKPWPAGWADREVKGGFGVMLDDVFAALYVAIILYAVSLFLAS